MARGKYGYSGVYNASPITLDDGEGSALAVNASGELLVNLEAADIQIGSVELKDADSAALANIKAANTARTTATVVIATQNVDAAGLVSGALPAATALADAASATPTTPTVGTVPLLMNATTIDRARAVVNALNSTGTGIAAAGLVAQLDDTSPTTITENQFGNVRMSPARALYTEPGPFTYLNIAAGQATTVVKASAGFLHGIVFNSAATATNVTTVYDHASGVGTVIAIPNAVAATVPNTILFDCAFTTGLTIITATANGSNMTVIYR